MTKSEAQFLSGLYERNHRLCALYILVRNLVKWPLEIFAMLPLAIAFGFFIFIVQGFWNAGKEICETIVLECTEFASDWRSVYLAWIGKDKKESGGTNGNK